MSDTHPTARYSAVAIALHWAIALGIAGMIAAGWFMSDLSNDAPFKAALYQLHKSFGITILTLTIARILWRIMNPPPPLPEDMRPVERTASHSVHLAFYGLMILMPLSGWALVSTSAFSVPTVIFGAVSWPHLPLGHGEALHGVIEFVHSKLAWVAIALLALHVAGAVKHEFAAEEGVLKRMIPGLFGRTSRPMPPPKGFTVAFGAAALFFVAVAAIPLALGAGSSGGAPIAATPASTDTEIPLWTVSADDRALGFTVLYEGKPVTGRFEDWSASIAFDPANLAASRAIVEVDAASARTGTKLYDDSLRGSEWFGARNFPAITVTIDNIRAADDGAGYVGDMTFALKGNTITAASPFRFTADIDGDTAAVRGEITLTRTQLDLGLQSDPNAEWVADETTATVAFTASRAVPEAQ